MALNTVTLTGTLPRAGGALAVFTPSNWLTDAADSLLIPPEPVPVSLDGTGHFSVPLLATDNTGPLPSGWYWTAVITGIPDVAAETFSFFLAFADGATQDIAGLARISPVTVMAAYMPLSGGQFTGAIAPGVGAVADDGTTITLSAATGNLFRVTLTGNRVLALPSGGMDGQLARVEVTSNGHTLSYPPGYDMGAGSAPVLSSTPGKRDVLLFARNEAAGTWDLLAFAAGY